LEFLLLRGSAGDYHFEAGSDQKILFVLGLRASAARCQYEKREGTDKTESSEEVFHGILFGSPLFSVDSSIR